MAANPYPNPIPNLLPHLIRWLLIASKRVEYLRQKSLEARRQHAIEDEKEAYRRRGAALQQQALEQRSHAAAAERNMVEWKQKRQRHI